MRQPSYGVLVRLTQAMKAREWVRDSVCGRVLALPFFSVQPTFIGSG
jgi:hypothetical protein